MPTIPNRPSKLFRKLLLTPLQEHKQNGKVRITKPATKPTFKPPKYKATWNSTLPHPFKCSKCSYIATNKADFNNHWSLDH